MRRLFIRFTENINEDIERGTSILTQENDEISDGLCAFPGKETLEETRKKVAILGNVVANKGDKYAIVEARQNINAKSGTLGVVIVDVVVIEEGIV